MNRSTKTSREPTAPGTLRPTAEEHAPFYAAYVARVPEGDLVEILERQIEETIRPLASLTEGDAGFAYAPGKWTVREVVGHVIDAERVFAYRALRFARGDATPLPGFDEQEWARASNADDRPLADLLAELRTVRAATVALLRPLPPEAWLRRGEANGIRCTVRALATIIAGHELHHRAVLEERYYPAIGVGVSS